MARFWGNKRKGERKEKDELVALTPLERLVLGAGPIRADGTDKFYGFENFGNTCYCNSILQPLFYCEPFREAILSYDFPTSSDPRGPRPQVVDRAWRDPEKVAAQAVALKASGAADAMKKKPSIPSGVGMPLINVNVRPEDKPDTPEWKKKQIMIKGPVLELRYEVEDVALKPSDTTLSSLQDLFRALLETETRTGVLSPQRLLQVFKSHYDAFQSPQHQDAHEFLGLMLNSIINTVEAHTKQLRDQELVSAALDGAPTGLLAPPSTGWVHDIFEGVLTSETRCLTCETASQRDETFLDLSIDLDSHVSVTTCLRNFSREEMLCERNKFHCDTCGGLQEAEKRMKVKRLPKVLALHLKRFKMTDYHGNSTKLFHRVTYPAQLRMSSTAGDAADLERLYELYAVVIHVGPQAAQGHYVSVIKTKDWGWLLFDDELVEPVDEDYVNLFFGGVDGQPCAYVLFYQEKQADTFMAEQTLSEQAGIKPESTPGSLPNGKDHALNLSGMPNGIHGSKSEAQLLARLDELSNVGALASTSDIEHPPATPTTPSSGIGGFKVWRRREQESFAKKFTERTKSKERSKQKGGESSRPNGIDGAHVTNGVHGVNGASTKEDEHTSAPVDLDLAGKAIINGIQDAQGSTEAERFVSASAPTPGHWSGLNRSGKGSKSLSKRSFAFLSNRNGKISDLDLSGKNSPRPAESQADSPRDSGAADRDVSENGEVSSTDQNNHNKENGLTNNSNNNNTTQENGTAKPKDQERGRDKEKDKERDKEKDKDKDWFRFRRKKSINLLSLAGRGEDVGLVAAGVGVGAGAARDGQ